MKLVQKLFRSYDTAYNERISRMSNNHADALVTLTSTTKSNMKRTIKVEFLPKPSIDAEQEYNMVFNIEADLGVCWMYPIIYYLRNGYAHKIRAQASRYWLSPNQKLYKRSFLGLYLRCIHPKKVQDILYELHEGSCGNHIGGQSLAHRARRQSYQWPYMQKDTLAYTKKCDKCQKHSPIIHQPAI